MSLRVEAFQVGPLANNLYLLIDEPAREAVVIDPSIESDAALARVRELSGQGLRLRAIWNTHGHFDHVYDNARWKAAFPVPLLMHPGDVFFLDRLREQALWLGFPAPERVEPDRWLEAGQTLELGRHRARVLHTPGHSPGSVSFIFEDDGLCFSGDVLFRGSVGRTDLPGGSDEQLGQSLRTLLELPAGTRVLPGHNEATTIGHETRTNPFCRQPANPQPDFLKETA